MPSLDTPITVNDSTFENWILQSPLPVALLFCTPKFPKCQQIQPLWRNLAKEYAEQLLVAQVTVDDNRQWARHYGITALPTTLWLRDGKEVQRAEGLPDQAELQERANALLENRTPRLPEKPKPTFSSAKGPVKLTDTTFHKALRDTRPVLVDFWAPWCGPCRMIAPTIEKLAKEMGDRALIAKLNTDENQQTARQYRVMSIPMLLIFRNGKVVDTMVGVQSPPVLRQRLLAQM